MMKIIGCVLFISLGLLASSLDDVAAKAKVQNKRIIVELAMESCSYCEKMDKFVLSKEDVKSAIDKSYIFLKLDIHKDEIPELFSSRMTPTFYILTADSIILHEVIGAPSKSEFMSLLARFGAQK